MMTIKRFSQRTNEEFTAAIQDEIRRRAYQLYVASGGEKGHALEHWLLAEAELQNRYTLRIDS